MTRRHSNSKLFFSASALLLALLSGCGHKQKTPYTPPPPTIDATPHTTRRTQPTTPPTASTQPAATAPIGPSEEEIRYVATHKPIYSEEGYATWYTAAKGRHTANGDLFNDDALTAAHRSLPFGSLIKVTNLKTNQSVILRITDRGPFVEGRSLDLTRAAAKAIGNYREGLSHVRIDVYQSPKPIESGGKWVVQIGAFKSEDNALKLKAQLQKKYPAAKVISFPGGESTFWVRIRPTDADREEAEKIAARLKPVEGAAYLTRID